MRAVHDDEEEASEFFSALCFVCHIEKVEQHSIRCSCQSQLSKSNVEVLK